MRIACVLWSGDVGGAQTSTVALCHAARDAGVEVGIVFVSQPEPLSILLDHIGIPYRALGLPRGASVLAHPRRLAAVVAEVGRSGAIVVETGYLAAALRVGGYRGRLVTVEHGVLLGLASMTPMRRALQRAGRRTGVWATDVEVAVSDFMLAEISRHTRPREVVRIYNGVDLARFSPDPTTRRTGPIRIGWGGRIVAGKGVDVLIHACALLRDSFELELRVAGDGPSLAEARGLSSRLGLANVVRFLGPWTICPATGAMLMWSRNRRIPSLSRSACLPLKQWHLESPWWQPGSAHCRKSFPMDFLER